MVTFITHTPPVSLGLASPERYRQTVSEELEDGTRLSEFPTRVYTAEERSVARRLIEGGFRHRLVVIGSPEFRLKVNEALEMLRVAGYIDFLSAYVEKIVRTEGISQLREEEAALWLGEKVVEDPLEAARFVVQKAEQMRCYLEGLETYLGTVERRSVMRSLEFLEFLRDKSGDEAVRNRCEELLKRWSEGHTL